jgi:hypothetical protein
MYDWNYILSVVTISAVFSYVETANECTTGITFGNRTKQTLVL